MNHNPVMPIIDKPLQNFCEAYYAHGDLEKAVSESGVPVPIMDTNEEVGHRLLARRDVRDYLCILGGDDGSNIDSLIERLAALRRAAVRRNDVKLAKEIEMNIAQLRGHLIERTQNTNLNANIHAATDISTTELLHRLSGVPEKKLLQHGVKLIDGKVQRVDVE